MSTFAGVQFFETDAEETARLAAAPEGSINHELSSLPIRNRFIDKGMLLTLPALNGNTHTITVAVVSNKGSFTPSPEAREARKFPYQHNNMFHCMVVASDHPSYPVGGHDLACSEAELRRAKPVSL